MITHTISSANRNAVINEQGVQNSTESHTLMSACPFTYCSTCFT